MDESMSADAKNFEAQKEFWRQHHHKCHRRPWMWIIVILILVGIAFHWHYRRGMFQEYRYSANAMGVHKPVYWMSIKTQDQLDKIRHLDIMGADRAKVGDAVSYGVRGFSVIPSKRFTSPDKVVKDISPMTKLAISFDGVSLVPDLMVTFPKPFKLDLLKTDAQVWQAAKSRWLRGKAGLSVGAAVHCVEHKKCYVIDKETLAKDFEKITPLSSVSWTASR